MMSFPLLQTSKALNLVESIRYIAYLLSVSTSQCQFFSFYGNVLLPLSDNIIGINLRVQKT